MREPPRRGRALARQLSCCWLADGPGRIARAQLLRSVQEGLARDEYRLRTCSVGTISCRYTAWHDAPYKSWCPFASFQEIHQMVDTGQTAPDKVTSSICVHCEPVRQGMDAWSTGQTVWTPGTSHDQQEHTLSSTKKEILGCCINRLLVAYTTAVPATRCPIPPR